MPSTKEKPMFKNGIDVRGREFFMKLSSSGNYLRISEDEWLRGVGKKGSSLLMGKIKTKRPAFEINAYRVGKESQYGYRRKSDGSYVQKVVPGRVFASSKRSISDRYDMVKLLLKNEGITYSKSLLDYLAGGQGAVFDVVQAAKREAIKEHGSHAAWNAKGKRLLIRHCKNALDVPWIVIKKTTAKKPTVKRPVAVKPAAKKPIKPTPAKKPAVKKAAIKKNDPLKPNASVAQAPRKDPMKPEKVSTISKAEEKQLVAQGIPPEVIKEIKETAAPGALENVLGVLKFIRDSVISGEGDPMVTDISAFQDDQYEDAESGEESESEKKSQKKK
jgi:hypothetical protein